LKPEERLLLRAGKNTFRMHLPDMAVIDIVPDNDDLTECLKSLPKDSLRATVELDHVLKSITRFIIPFEFFIEDWRRNFWYPMRLFTNSQSSWNWKIDNYC